MPKMQLYRLCGIIIFYNIDYTFIQLHFRVWWKHFSIIHLQRDILEYNSESMWRL